jgi:hypothetical protein
MEEFCAKMVNTRMFCVWCAFADIIGTAGNSPRDGMILLHSRELARVSQSDHQLSNQVPATHLIMHRASEGVVMPNRTSQKTMKTMTTTGLLFHALARAEMVRIQDLRSRICRISSLKEVWISDFALVQ